VLDRRATQDVEGLLVAFEERLLALGGERPMHRLAREREPQREQETLGADPNQIDPQIREVDLGLRPGSWVCGTDASSPAAAQISGLRFAT